MNHIYLARGGGEGAGKGHIFQPMYVCVCVWGCACVCVCVVVLFYFLSLFCPSNPVNGSTPYFVSTEIFLKFLQKKQFYCGQKKAHLIG